MKVSVIMPCFNVEATLIRALDSVMMQETDFEYEVLIIDDASTDQTVKIAEQYVRQHSQVKLICNERNMGNAYTYYTGLCAASGDYFCVLDGDDYYTIPDKLQRQADFLDSDLAEDYVGVATQYVIDLGNRMVSIPDRNMHSEFTYADFLTQNSGYCHTATYMYRNIFRGNVPAQMGESLYRGDTPRTMFHLAYSGKKIKVLDFVGSAYTFEFNGIWSGLKQKQQFEYQISYQTRHKENVSTEFERDCADRLIAFNRSKMEQAKDDYRRYPAITIDQALKYLSEYAGRFAFGQKDFVFQHVYYSLYVDTLCTSLGTIDLVRNPEHIQKERCSENICIVNAVLNPQGGGIFTEIEEMADIYEDKNVYLVVTAMKEISEEVQQVLAKHSNLSVLCPPEDCKERLKWFREQFVRVSPYRTYYFCSHEDTYGAALMQKGCCENITLFSFDHGYICGISNPNLDLIIAKRSIDYWMLKKKFGKKVIFIPTWNANPRDCEGKKYCPFLHHSALITASGAARYYKVDGKPPFRYIDFIVALLKQTSGIHYHFGEIPDNIQEELHEKMRRAGVPEGQFVYIPWADNIPVALLEKHVDVFIEPFPVISYKLTLEVLSVGVPVIVRQGIMRMSIVDFVPQGTMIWHDEQEFISILSNLTMEKLKEASGKALEYFQTHHCIKVIGRLLRANAGLPEPEKTYCPDNVLMDITASLRLFGNNFKFSIMDKANEAEREKTAEMRKEEQCIVEKNRKMEEQKRLEEQVNAIRSLRTFRIGFVSTLPLRFFKQIARYSMQFGPIQGMIRMKRDRILFYQSDCREKELNFLQNSIALKFGEKLAIPYRWIRYGRQYEQMTQIREYLKIQQREIARQHDELVRMRHLLDKQKCMLDENIGFEKSQFLRLYSSIVEAKEKCDERLKLFEVDVADVKKILIELNGQGGVVDKIISFVNTVRIQWDDQLKLLAANAADEKKALTQLSQQFGAADKNQKNELGRKESEAKRFMIKTVAKTMERSVIEHLDYHLTEHCNLNCAGCSTFAPIADVNFADLDLFEHDMKLLHGLVGDAVQQIHLLGGEPLLHPKASQFACVCRSVFKKARIDITTNGLLVYDMQDSFWEVLAANNIAIKYTRYPVNFDYKKMVEYIKKKGVFVFSAGGEKAIKYFRRIPLNTKGTFNMYNSFVQCPYTDCAQLRNGKLYHCPASAFSDIPNRRILKEDKMAGGFLLSEADYIDLSCAESGMDVFRFLSNAIPFCQYCDMEQADECVEWSISKCDLREWVEL